MIFFLSLTLTDASEETFGWVSWLQSGLVGLHPLISKIIKGSFFALALGKLKKPWTYLPVVKKNQKRASFSYFSLHAAPLEWEQGKAEKPYGVEAWKSLPP